MGIVNLGLATLYLVIVSTEEGLTRIPRSLREGSMALELRKQRLYLGLFYHGEAPLF